jgi:hypothetical protein
MINLTTRPVYPLCRWIGSQMGPEPVWIDREKEILSLLTIEPRSFIPKTVTDEIMYHSFRRSRGSSVSTVSGYGLDDRAISVRSPTEAKEFSSILCVQTGSGAHPASCTMGTGGPFPGVKGGRGRDADRSPLSSAEVVNE